MPQPSPMDGFMRLPRGRGKKRARASEGGDIAVHTAQRGYARKRAKDQQERGPRVSSQAESWESGHNDLMPSFYNAVAPAV